MGRPKKPPEPCTGPGCDLPAYARGLCRGHYAQDQRGSPLHPLRAPDAPVLVRVSLRVSGHCAEAIKHDIEGARGALEKWAAGRTKEHAKEEAKR